MADACRRWLVLAALAVAVSGCGYRTDEHGMTALMRAAAAGNAAEVAALIARGHPVNAHVRAGLVYQARVFLSVLAFFGEGPPKRDPGYTALMYAAENGHDDVAEQLLAAGADPNAREFWEMRALHIALARLQPAPRLVEVLVAAGSDVNACGGLAYRRWTPLMYAAQQGAAESVQLLLRAGSAIDAVDKEGWTALMLAARSGRADVVRVLVDAGADREMRDRIAHRTALDWANEDRQAAVVDLLRAAGASTAGLTDQALLQAVMLRNVEGTRQALASGARVEARTAQGESVLFVAARSGVPEIVSMLLEAGAEVHFRHRVFGSPLTEASSGGHSEIVRQLLAAGAKPDANGETALARAALAGRAGIVDQLLAAGADPNAGHGAVLREAVRGEDVQIVERLLAAGADPNLHTDASTTALIQASLRGRADMVRRLLEARADPDIVDHVDYTALWSAAALGHDDVVGLLLKAGADRNHQKDGETPEQVARRSGHDAVAERIRDAGSRI